MALFDGKRSLISSATDPLQEPEQSPRPDNSAEQHQERPRPEPTVNVIAQRADSEIERYKEDAKGEKTFRRKSLLVQWCLFSATMLAFAAAAIYAHIAKRTLDEISRQTPEIAKSADAAKKSADLAYRSLAAANAAQCSVGINNRDRPPHMYFAVGCVEGKVEAEIISGNLEISLRNPRTGRRLNKPMAYKLTPGRPQGQTDFDVSGFSETEFYSLRQAIYIEGTFSYNDGFDRIVTKKVCQAALPFRNDTSGEYSGMSTFDCNGRLSIEDQIRTWDAKDKAKSNKKP